MRKEVDPMGEIENSIRDAQARVADVDNTVTATNAEIDAEVKSKG